MKRGLRDESALCLVDFEHANARKSPTGRDPFPQPSLVDEQREERVDLGDAPARVDLARVPGERAVDQDHAPVHGDDRRVDDVFYVLCTRHADGSCRSLSAGGELEQQIEDGDDEEVDQADEVQACGKRSPFGVSLAASEPRTRFMNRHRL